jgi:peptidoglycan/LPS O-acetylase OafA/YrhL
MDRTPSDLASLKDQHPSVRTFGLKLGHRPELDSLRGISILLIYIHHLYHPVLPAGFLGLDIFFVLSGFLITSLLVEEWKRESSISLKDFYIRRILRLMPALFLVVLIIGCFALIVLDKKTATETYQGIWLTLSSVSNWFYAFRYFSLKNAFGITWSLAIEEQFYLTWPLFLSLALRFRLQRRWILYILILSIAIIPLHRKILVAQGADVFRLYFGSDTRADGLLIGCLVGLLVSWNLLPHNKRSAVCMKFLPAVGVIFFGYLVSYPSWTDLLLYQYGGFTLVSLSVASFLIMLILWPPKIVLSVLNFTPLVWIGRISYGLFLWHWPIRWFIYQKKAMPTSTEQLVAVVVLSLLVSTLSYHFVEKPFLRLKKRFGST